MSEAMVRISRLLPLIFFLCLLKLPFTNLISHLLQYNLLEESDAVRPTNIGFLLVESFFEKNNLVMPLFSCSIVWPTSITFPAPRRSNLGVDEL